jgi:hypothetical protein
MLGIPKTSGWDGGIPVDARSGEGPLGETVENFTPAMTFFNLSPSAVKF